MGEKPAFDLKIDKERGLTDGVAEDPRNGHQHGQPHVDKAGKGERAYIPNFSDTPFVNFTNTLVKNQFFLLEFPRQWIFFVHSTPLPPPHTHTIMDMRKNKRRNALTNMRVTFSQSETSSPLRGGGEGRGVKILITTGWAGGGGGVNRKDLQKL